MSAEQSSSVREIDEPGYERGRDAVLKPEALEPIDLEDPDTTGLYTWRQLSPPGARPPHAEETPVIVMQSPERRDDYYFVPAFSAAHGQILELCLDETGMQVVFSAEGMARGFGRLDRRIGYLVESNGTLEDEFAGLLA